MSDRLVLSPAELAAELGVSRATAYRVANQIGVRISPRRIVVPVARLQAWLDSEAAAIGSRGRSASAASGSSSAAERGVTR